MKMYEIKIKDRKINRLKEFLVEVDALCKDLDELCKSKVETHIQLKLDKIYSEWESK